MSTEVGYVEMRNWPTLCTEYRCYRAQPLILSVFILPIIRLLLGYHKILSLTYLKRAAVEERKRLQIFHCYKVSFKDMLYKFMSLFEKAITLPIDVITYKLFIAYKFSQT